jgi:hypothetical protein
MACHHKWWPAQALIAILLTTAAPRALACPDGYSSNFLGMCMPNIGKGGAIDPLRVPTEVVVETTAPILKNLILASRQEAFNRGTWALPPQVIQEFSGFYAPDVLAVQWGIGGGNDLSIQANSFRYGDRAAIVLDTVVVFRSMNDASVSNLRLWAHELAHVEQYRAWGIDNFTKRYIRDFNAVEAEADRRANEFISWRQANAASDSSQSGFPLPPASSPSPGEGSMCVTPMGACPWIGPVGWNCVCAINAVLWQGVISK